jgi:1-acyl-sn-glycerol-3-phosphate acyltransferase
MTVEWHCEKDGRQPRVFYANHASHLDFVMIWSAIPRARRRETLPVARRDYWSASRVRRFVATWIFHAVLIERSPAAVETMAEELDRRRSLILFPEGTRSRNGVIGAFRTGLYYLSRLRPDVDLVPVFVENAGRMLPKGEALPVPMVCRIVFGEPLRAGATESRDAFLVRARDALIRLGGSDVRPH